MLNATEQCDATRALERLKAGNEAYLQASCNKADISPSLRQGLSSHGQFPYACIVTCADSRVVPEHVFTAGLGELFTIRVAGNVIGQMELASCLYAAEHLGARLVVVLGHTQCGAVASAMEAADAGVLEGADEDALMPLVRQVAQAIGDERDPYRASVLNARRSQADLLADPSLAHLVQEGALEVRAAIYHIDSGEVEFLDN